MFRPHPSDPAYGVEPDYSDSDSDDAKKPEVDKPDSAQPSRDSPALSEEDWARIVASAGRSVSRLGGFENTD